MMLRRDDEMFSCGFVMGVLIGLIVGGVIAVWSYSSELREQDNLIEALRKQCGAPDPDSQ